MYVHGIFFLGKYGNGEMKEKIGFFRSWYKVRLQRTRDRLQRKAEIYRLGKIGINLNLVLADHRRSRIEDFTV